MNLGRRLRALLRAVRIGERRWIPSAEARAVHAGLVRDRLRRFAEQDATGPSADPPDSE